MSSAASCSPFRKNGFCHVVPEVRRHRGFPPEIPPALHDATSVTFDLDDANADLTGTITIVREEQTRT